MTTRRSHDPQRDDSHRGTAHDAPPADPAHAPGKQHLELDLEVEQHDRPGHQVSPETASHRSESESRVGRGRTPRRG